MASSFGTNSSSQGDTSSVPYDNADTSRCRMTCA